MKASTKLVIGLAGLGVVAFVLYKTGKGVANAVPKALGAAGSAINPLNPENIFASGVNAVGAALSGSPGFSLGSWIYDVTHPGESALITGPSASSAKYAKPPLTSSGSVASPYGPSGDPYNDGAQYQAWEEEQNYSNEGRSSVQPIEYFPGLTAAEAMGFPG